MSYSSAKYDINQAVYHLEEEVKRVPLPQEVRSDVLASLWEVHRKITQALSEEEDVHS